MENTKQSQWKPQERLEPAASVIAKLGGLSAVSRLTGTTAQTVLRWRFPKTAGGTGGVIPQRYHLLLLDDAKSKGISLTADDLLPKTRW